MEAGTNPEIRVDAESVRCPWLFSARVSGVRGRGNGRGPVGDSFLVNMGRNIFAVGDAPDWNPGASQSFLMALNGTVEEACRSRRGGDVPGDSLPAATIVGNVNTLVRDTDYRASTAFTCAVLMGGPSGTKALVLHCGDTVLFEADVTSGRIRQVSRTSMSYAGRVKGLSQVETIDVQCGTRFLMCSDGVHAVLRNGTFRDTKSVMLDALCRHDVGHVADAILASYPVDIEFPDDIVVVALDPGKLVASGPAKVITGAPGVIGESAWCFGVERYGSTALTAT
jgi:hypothetical protein